MMNTHNTGPSEAFRGSTGEVAPSPLRVAMIDGMRDVFMVRSWEARKYSDIK